MCTCATYGSVQYANLWLTCMDSPHAPGCSTSTFGATYYILTSLSVWPASNSRHIVIPILHIRRIPCPTPEVIPEAVVFGIVILKGYPHQNKIKSIEIVQRKPVINGGGFIHGE